jgi:hypothetical protein
VELTLHKERQYIEQYMNKYTLHLHQEHIRHYLDRVLVVYNIDLNLENMIL